MVQKLIINLKADLDYLSIISWPLAMDLIGCPSRSYLDPRSMVMRFTTNGLGSHGQKVLSNSSQHSIHVQKIRKTGHAGWYFINHNIMHT